MYCTAGRGTAFGRVIVCVLLLTALAVPGQAASFTAFESAHVRPLALSADGHMLYAVNTPDNRLEIFSPDGNGIEPTSSVAVGLEPVALAVHDKTVWVVNQLSDSVSIIDISEQPPRLIRTLLVGDEPRDIVFAGPNQSRAFITTAHRGQNTVVDPQLTTPGVGRADVWVFDAEDQGDSFKGSPLTVLTLFGDTPRALAATADGSRVYAAVFLSGNRTATVSQEAVCDGGAAVTSCEVEGVTMPGGLPPPNTNVDGVAQPEVGLIVRFDATSGAWLDELGRDWRQALRFSLPDHDVFAIDATADPPREVDSFAGVGTVIYGLAVNPVSGAVYAANTEANNASRFSGPGVFAGHSVRGHLHESRITVISPTGVQPVRLNSHIDYSVVPSPPDVAARSLSLPVAVAVDATGEHLYVVATGSDRVAALDTQALEDGSFTPSADNQIAVSGGGPSGLVLDGDRQQLYVTTRFDNGISVIDLDTRQEIQHLRLFNPEPEAVVAGRRFLYDARLSSSNGEQSCGSCHVSGHIDGLAWDLGNPDGHVVPNPNPIASLPSAGGNIPNRVFHPMKGPMTTQTLRGMRLNGPMHWRGDRTTGMLSPADSTDEVANFLQFNEAFDSLMGRGAPIAAADMRAFADFALSLTPPPNPNRALDNSLTPAQQAHFVEFSQNQNCTKCHVLDPAAGFFGTDGHSALNPNPGPRDFFKIPSLRGAYEKVGMFWIPPGVPFGDRQPIGDQVRGFGILNDGSSGRLPPPTEQYILIFDSNLAPMVGQQVTLTTRDSAAAFTRLDLMRTRAAVGECDLVAKGVVDNEARGWYRTASGELQSDRAAETLADAALHQLVESGSAEITFSCVPPGSGVRFAVDRDSDGIFDRDELDLGSDPADPGSVPATPTPTQSASPTPTATPPAWICPGDCDGNGEVTVDELLLGVRLILATAEAQTCAALDRNGDAEVTVDELVFAITATLDGCAAFQPTLPPTPAPTSAALQFVDVAAAAGLTYVQYQTPNPFDGEQEYFSGGAAVGDFDGDGWPDIYATRLDGPDLLYRNNKDGTFTDVSAPAGLASFSLRSNGAAWGDIDNDGDLDLYVTVIGADQHRFYLFINDGSGHFTEEAEARGAAVAGTDPHFGFSASFGDYDRDGYIDLHVTEWRPSAYNLPMAKSNTRLLHNRGAAAPGNFVDVTEQAGVSIDGVIPPRQTVGRGLAFSSRFVDMDDDGWPDLLIAADFGTSRIFWNRGDGTFKDGTVAAGVGKEENGMGMAVGDYDGDGRLDWFVTSIWDPLSLCTDGFFCLWGTSGNRLYRNAGQRRFVDQTDAVGVRIGGWGWGATFWDFDNDGDLDLVMTNGAHFPQLDALGRGQLDDGYEHDPMRAWRNDNGVMVDVSQALGLTDTRAGKGLMAFDYDQDGDLDLLIVNNSATPVLYRNDGGNLNDWLNVRVQGTSSNRDGIGARITVTADAGGVSQVREIDGGSNFLGQNELTAHFGLGSHPAPVHSVEVYWPASNIRQVLHDVPARSVVTVRETAG
ncbi:MAG: VCBS repeat-containing protein [Deltaproteobacteria bacterium]|nr:VCBS repeat-containing protein [Deltaproteobacteria bacterium]